eukprot:643907-Alexandrium_andersonii.AAC.1
MSGEGYVGQGVRKLQVRARVRSCGLSVRAGFASARRHRGSGCKGAGALPPDPDTWRPPCG